MVYVGMNQYKIVLVLIIFLYDTFIISYPFEKDCEHIFIKVSHHQRTMYNGLFVNGFPKYFNSYI